jgi:hypothetical protein
MKRTFRLTAEGKNDARVRDKVRHEINKYVKRERRKEVPEGYFRWDMKCRMGPAEAAAVEVLLKEIGPGIDQAGEAGANQVFVEITAVPVKRSPKAPAPNPDSA